MNIKAQFVSICLGQRSLNTASLRVHWIMSMEKSRLITFWAGDPKLEYHLSQSSQPLLNDWVGQWRNVWVNLRKYSNRNTTSLRVHNPYWTTGWVNEEMSEWISENTPIGIPPLSEYTTPWWMTGRVNGKFCTNLRIVCMGIWPTSPWGKKTR